MAGRILFECRSKSGRIDLVSGKLRWLAITCSAFAKTRRFNIRNHLDSRNSRFPAGLAALRWTAEGGCPHMICAD
jgi:hypothetical protein